MTRNIQKILLLRFKNPIFKKIKHPLHLYPPLTLKHIQLCLEQKFHYQTKFIDGWINTGDIRHLAQTSLSFKPDCLIAYLEKPAERENLVDFLFMTKYNNLLKIGIGPDVTTRPHAYINHNSIFDFCIPGEPEEAISFFFDKLISTAIKKEDLIDFFKEEMSKNKINVVEDLSQLNPLHFTKKELRDYPFTYPLRLNQKLISGYTMASRGCPHHCTFCSPMIRKSYGKTIRHRPSEIIIKEIKNMVQQGANFVSFEDDNFGTDTQWSDSFCRAIIENDIKITWAAQIRADTLLKNENIALMKQAGCILLQLGVETASEKLIASLQKTSDPKNWRSRCLSTFTMIKKHGIATCALFMIGIPGETEEDLKNNIKFAIDINPDLIKLHFFTLYPGCQTYQKNDAGPLISEPEQTHHHNPMNKNLFQKRNYFYLKFICRPAYLIEHISKYTGFYLKNIYIFKYLVKNTLSMVFYFKK